jgi:hypothetical protein
VHDSGDRLTLLGRVVATLERAAIPHALIGAAALAAHGTSRSTVDIDLLAVDPSCLDPRLWAGLRNSGVAVDLRRGDDSDPLAGVVRFTAAADRPVDLVVGRSAWQRSAVERAEPGRFGSVTMPILRAADLILLKLFAGGPQDAWDIAQLLAAGDRRALAADVERRLPDLPPTAASLWRTLRPAPRAG